MSSLRLAAFAVCAPGLEPLVAAEIERLGVRGARLRRGGVDASLTLAQLWSANLRLRIATRILVRLGRIPAAGFGELQAGLRRIDWAAWLPPGTAVRLKVASSSSALFHTEAIALRAGEVLSAVGYEVVAGATRSSTDDERAEAQAIHLRMTGDVALVSLDASGEPLHRRGWRLAGGKAPLRETLAAALVAHSGWDRRAPFVDPFCGSGTIAIEAALIARRVAPGRNRRFAFERWANFDPSAWSRLVAGADADVVASKASIVAADRDPGAIAAAQANAARAGVAEAIEFRQAPISALELPRRPGWVVTNPPYGRRLRGGDLRDLYDAFGRILAERAAGWRVAAVASERAPITRLRQPFTRRVHTTNGGLPVDLVAT